MVRRLRQATRLPHLRVRKPDAWLVVRVEGQGFGTVNPLLLGDGVTGIGGQISGDGHHGAEYDTAFEIWFHELELVLC